MAKTARNTATFSRLTGVGQRWLVAAIALAATFQAGAGPADKFELAKAIPADAVAAVLARSHSGQEFVRTQYERVWAAMETARLDRVLKTAMRRVVTADGTTTREKFEEDWLEINDLIAGVEWSQLMAREVAFASKVGLPSDFIILCRPKPDTVDKSFEGLSAILKRLTDLAPELSVKELDSEGLHTLQVALPAPFPISITLAKYKDVLAFGVGASMVEQSLGLLTGEVEGSLVATERFEKAFTDLPSGEDEIVYVDLERLFAQLRQMVSMAQGDMPPPAEGELNPVKIANAVLDELDVFETIAAVGTTKGMQKRMESVAIIRPDSEKKILHAALFGNPPLEDPFRYIPVQATGVNVNSGFNLKKLYTGILQFIEREIPNGAVQVESFKQEMSNGGFDPEADLLNWLEGGMAMFSVPGPTKFAPAEWVWLLKVSDPEQANAKLSELMGFVGQQLGEQGQVNAVQIADAPFHTVVQPMLAAFGLTPVAGVKDKNLIVGSSKRIIETSMQATEPDKTFAANERYKKEGLPLGKNVVAFSFTDTTQFGEQMAQAMQMLQMASMFGGQELQQNVGLSTLIRLAGKMAPVMRELNFYQSTCAQTTFDGKELRTITLVNYREPPKPKVEEEEEGVEESDTQASAPNSAEATN